MVLALDVATRSRLRNGVAYIRSSCGGGFWGEHSRSLPRTRARGSLCEACQWLHTRLFAAWCAHPAMCSFVPPEGHVTGACMHVSRNVPHAAWRRCARLARRACIAGACAGRVAPDTPFGLLRAASTIGCSFPCAAVAHYKRYLCDARAVTVSPHRKSPCADHS